MTKTRSVLRDQDLGGRRVCVHLPFDWQYGWMATETTTAVLAAKRTQLEEQLASLSELPDEQGIIAFGTRVGEGTSQAVDRLSAVPAHDQLQVTLAEVVRAEEKVAESSYGACDVCGNDIGDNRLRARPWATRCLDHAA